MLFTCANLKISYVLNDKISITLLNYLKNKAWHTKPRAKIEKEAENMGKMEKFLDKETQIITN